MSKTAFVRYTTTLSFPVTEGMTRRQIEREAEKLAEKLLEAIDPLDAGGVGHCPSDIEIVEDSELEVP